MRPDSHTDLAWQELASGVRLVATDLDGTLLRPGGDVSEFTVSTLARARAEGLPVVFVTGRPPRWLPEIVEQTDHRTLAVSANGALILDLATEEVLVTRPLDPAVIDAVVDLLRAEVPGIGFAAEWVAIGDEVPFSHEVGYRARYPVPDAAIVGDVRELTRGRDIVKLLARVHGGDHDADSFLAHGLDHVSHLVTVTHSNSADVLLEMSAHGVTKGLALADVADMLGVPAPAVAAAGDMPNDIPMLDWAGVGLAVEGAHADVVAAAAAVLPGPAADGVARFVDAVLGS